MVIAVKLDGGLPFFLVAAAATATKVDLRPSEDPHNETMEANKREGLFVMPTSFNYYWVAEIQEGRKPDHRIGGNGRI